jgi:hypothetical protein
MDYSYRCNNWWIYSRGAGAMAATMIAGAGAKNLEHMQKTGEIPTINQVIN